MKSILSVLLYKGDNPLLLPLEKTFEITHFYFYKESLFVTSPKNCLLHQLKLPTKLFINYLFSCYDLGLAVLFKWSSLPSKQIHAQSQHKTH